ncbi:hypothetical protein [Deinococcus wulumuqiensis]|uniref:hypothetical protein n=1 Tax=Deinococcus wulumuqiensis TaxID=980427 RepID=UPI001F088456|nr:hypothetical protein [Deinococcus wulumuqiensis]
MSPTRLWPALFLLCSLASAQVSGLSAAALGAVPPAPVSPALVSPATVSPATVSPESVTGVAALPGGTRLVCAETSLWKLGAGKPVRFTLPESCQGLRVSPSGQLALVAGAKAATVWHLGDGKMLTQIQWPDPARRAAFLGDAALLLAGANGLERLDLGTQARTSLRPGAATGAVTGVVAAPDGQRAVVGDGTRVQLVNLADGQVLSGVRCEAACPVQDAQFGAGRRVAVVRAGDTLYALREGHPATVVLRGAQGSAGFPLAGGGVWVLTAGRIERRDAQTGRREGVVRPEGVSGPAAWTPQGGLLFVSGRELVELDAAGREAGRTALP